MKSRAKRLQSFLAAISTLAILAAGTGNLSVYAQKKKPAPKTTTSKTTTSTTTAAKPVTPATPYDSGYAGGYAQGYTQGTGDWRQGVPRDLRRTDAYNRREQLYDAKMADLEEYRQGFDLGLEMGYNDGYYGRSRNPEVPANGIILAKAAALADAQRAREREQRARNREQQQNRPPQDRQATNQDSGATQATNRDNTANRDPQYQDSRRATTNVPLNLPNDTQLRLRLTSEISTKKARVGDIFTAEVTAPGSYERARIEGHVASLNKSGRISGKTELGLTFDTITLEDGRTGRLDAQLESIIESEKVKKVDEEGTVESGSKTKDSTVRGGIGAAAGALLGGIFGGAKGAIIGLAVGGAAGVGTVFVEGNKDLILEPGTEMTLRTARSGAR